MRWAHIAANAAAGFGEAVTMIATPLYSNTTLVSFLPTLGWGGTVVLTGKKFDARRYLELADQYRGTHTMLVPVQYQRLMAVPDFDSFDLSHFRLKTCTSAPFSAALKADVVARWPGAARRILRHDRRRRVLRPQLHRLPGQAPHRRPTAARPHDQADR